MNHVRILSCVLICIFKDSEQLFNHSYLLINLLINICYYLIYNTNSCFSINKITTNLRFEHFSLKNKYFTYCEMTYAI